MRPARWFAVFLIAASCAKPAPPPPPAATGTGQKDRGIYRKLNEPLPDDSADRVSLATLARGAVVTARTGEAMLETSALQAIDGDPGSIWMTPNHNLPQSMIVALPARSRIEKVGIRTESRGVFTAKHVQFEASSDAVRFTPLTTILSADSGDAQWFDVTPAEATHLRVTIVDAPLPDHDVRLYSILARGREIDRPRPGDLAGCWSINGRIARFTRHGDHITGTLTMGPMPLQIDGGFDGRIYRLSWIRGNDYGLALVTVAADGKHLSAIKWHEEAIPLFFGDSWFGERAGCSGAVAYDPETPAKLLQRTGRFSLFSRGADTLAWLARYIATGNPVQFVAHEFRQQDANANRAFAQRELDALREQLAKVDLSRVTFVARGSDAPRQGPVTEPMRALYSTIDLEIRNAGSQPAGPPAPSRQ